MSINERPDSDGTRPESERRGLDSERRGPDSETIWVFSFSFYACCF